MLTQTRINEDFSDWNKRLALAEKKLSELPDGWLPEYKQRKKCKGLERKYQAEIKHVNGLFKIAIDGLKIHGFKVPLY